MRGVQTALRLVRTAKLLAHEPSVPKWLRGLFVFGLLPIPLFFDELALIVATALLYVAHRQVVIEAWSRAGVEGQIGQEKSASSVLGPSDEGPHAALT